MPPLPSVGHCHSVEDLVKNFLCLHIVGVIIHGRPDARWFFPAGQQLSGDSNLNLDALRRALVDWCAPSEAHPAGRPLRRKLYLQFDNAGVWHMYMCLDMYMLNMHMCMLYNCMLYMCISYMCVLYMCVTETCACTPTTHMHMSSGLHMSMRNPLCRALIATPLLKVASSLAEWPALCKVVKVCVMHSGCLCCMRMHNMYMSMDRY